MDTVRELINLGKQCFDSKQYDQAEGYLRQVIQKHPHYADVLNMLGVINHIGGRFQAAMDFFRRALKINPRYTEALLNLAVLYNDLGRYPEAKKLYQGLKQRETKVATAIEPVLKGKLSNLHAEIGDIYRSIGLNTFAIEEYQKALRLNPAYRDIRTKLGQALRENGQLAAAVKELNAVVKTDGQYGPARVQLGVTYYTMGKMREAKLAWRAALDKNPEDDYAKMYLRLCEAQTAGKKTLEKHT